MGMNRNRPKKNPPRDRRPLLSVAMIAKNEERVIGRAIASVRPVAEEVVVVDTGSTDRTRQVALEHGARVIGHPWNHHYGEARTVSLRHCRGQYVLWLDADETVEAADLPLLQEYARAGQHELVACLSHLDRSYQVPEYHVEGLGEVTVLQVPRLARNLPGLHFQHRVHETLELPARVRDRQPALSAIRVVHHGRMTPSKGTYYDALLLLEHRDDPTDPHAAIYLAGRMVQADLPGAVLELLDGCDLSRATARHQLERYWYFRGWALATLGEQQPDPDRGQRLLQAALAAYDQAHTTLASIMAATLLIGIGREIEGLRLLEEAFERDPDHLQLQRVLSLARAYQENPELLRQQLSEYFQGLAWARQQAQQGAPAAELASSQPIAPSAGSGAQEAPEASTAALAGPPAPVTAALPRRLDLTHLRPRRGLVAPDFRGSMLPSRPAAAVTGAPLTT